MAFGAPPRTTGRVRTPPPRALPSFQVNYQGTDAQGVNSYEVLSADDGGTEVLRVLAPTNPAPGVPHNFLFVLPVEAGLGAVSGTGSRPCVPRRTGPVQSDDNRTFICNRAMVCG